jgi:hypothetical protein
VISRAGCLTGVVLAAIAACVSGCVYPSSGQHPGLVMCGTTLQPAGGGAGIAPDPVLRGSHSVSYGTGNGPLYFQVAPGCAHGNHVTWIPRSAAHLVDAAYASDGLAVVVVLQPTRPLTAFRLVATRNDRVVGTVTVRPAS